jgi:hypothetical protein
VRQVIPKDIPKLIHLGIALRAKGFLGSIPDLINSPAEIIKAIALN